VAREALRLFEVDERGLDKVDRGILAALCRTFGGAAVGLSTLAVSVGEEPRRWRTSSEPYLLKEGFLQRTPRGAWPPPPPSPTSAWPFRPTGRSGRFHPL